MSSCIFTLCLLVIILHVFVVCGCFSKSHFSKNYFRNIIRESNSLDPDQARHFVGPDLGPNYLQRLSAGDRSRQRVNIGFCVLVSLSTNKRLQYKHSLISYIQEEYTHKMKIPSSFIYPSYMLNYVHAG